MLARGREARLPWRVLGRCGIEVSAVGIGCWAIGGEDTNLGLPVGWSGTDETGSMKGLERADELGAALFDTADVYGHGRSERLVGRLLARVPRASVVVASKVGYFAGTAPHGYAPRHVRRQLEQTLENLGTDYLDIYLLHHADFGPDDRWLGGVVEAMHGFKQAGMVRAIGMRGPHRFALERDNLLTPVEHAAGAFALASEHGIGVLVNKPLAQGLLSGSHDPARPRSFGPGDHRRRKRWFTPPAVAVIQAGLGRLRARFGERPQDLIRIALWACLSRYEHAAVLVGFTKPWQVEMHLTCLGDPPAAEDLAAARAIMAQVQQQLDTSGGVFLDEPQDGQG